MRRKGLIGILLVCLMIGILPSYAIPDPSAVYCHELGYKFIIKKAEEGEFGRK